MKAAALVLSLFVLGCSGAVDKLTADEAVHLVMDQHVSEDARVFVYVHPEALKPGSDLRPYLPNPTRDAQPGQAEPIEIASESWFVWIDDSPGAMFEHANRFALVDCDTGEITISEQLWWPVLDGQALIWDEEEAIGDVDRLGAIEAASDPAAVTCVGNSGGAVVVNAHRDGELLEKDLHEGAQDMVNILTDAGFETSYYAKKGTEGARGVPLDAFFAFHELRQKLKAGDTLVVYLVGHGSFNESRGAADDASAGIIHEEDVRRWIQGFDECVNIIVMIESCKGGNFIDGLLDDVNLVMTSTDGKKPALADRDTRNFLVLETVPDRNPGDRGPEWTSSMTAALLEALQTQAEIDRIKQAAEANGQSFWEAAFADVFQNAKADDFAELNGLSMPLIRHGNRGKNKPPPTPVAPQCSNDAAGQACESLTPAQIVDLATASQRIFGGTESSALEGVCSQARELEVGNEVINGNLDVGTAAGFVDFAFVSAKRTCAGGGGFEFCDQPSGTPGIELECGQTDDSLVICPNGAGAVTGDAFVFTAVVDEAIPVDQSGTFFQFGLVFDDDGELSNNYRASPPYAGDFFDNTDLWHVGAKDPSAFWEMNVTDARGGKFANRASAARIYIQGHVISWVIPRDELLEEAPRFRITAHWHTGDFGEVGDWSGDLVPRVGSGLHTFLP